MSIDSILENKSLIKGFLTPIFQDELRGDAMLSPDDFGKVRDGYACAACLCEYVMFLVTCPVCGHARDLAMDLRDAPKPWMDHLHERETTEGQDLGKARTFDDFMADVNKNPDIDHTSISKIMPSKRFRK
jgi:hypothetical protein